MTRPAKPSKWAVVAGATAPAAQPAVVATPPTWHFPTEHRRYDRRPLTPAEQSAIVRLDEAWKARGVAADWRDRYAHEIGRIITPLDDALAALHISVGTLEARARRAGTLVLRHCGRVGAIYWEWSAEEWAQCAETAGQSRQYVFILAYALCKQPAYLFAEGHAYQVTMCDVIFGPEARLAHEVALQKAMHAVGFKSKGSADKATSPGWTKLPGAAAILMLEARSPHLEHTTLDILERVRRHERYGKTGQVMMGFSKALHKAGILASVLPHERGETSAHYTPLLTQGVPEAMAQVVERWHQTSALERSTKKAVRQHSLKVFRWLAVAHPEVTTLDQLTTPLVAEIIAAIDKASVGDMAARKTALGKKAGKPIKPRTKIYTLRALAMLCRDAQRWKWVQFRELDVHYDFRTPSRWVKLAGPDPRTIVTPVWLKLVYASLNLTSQDLDDFTDYPLAMVRATAVVWTHCALRSDEIGRLAVGCARDISGDVEEWLRQELAAEGEELDPEFKAKCAWLMVPAGKTASARGKPVGKVVADYIRAWEAERHPGQLAVTDRKTAEQVAYLFMVRAQPLGKNWINRTLIPLLCKKAGVPLEDVPEKKITSHRARASTASWLYNTRDSMSQEELAEWLGHKHVSSTRSYTSASPLKQARAFARASKNTYMVEVLVDTQAIESGETAKGKPYAYFPLGNGDYCGNKFYWSCKHRMVCPGCDFHVPGDSQKGTMLAARQGITVMLQQMELRDEEREALEGGLAATEKVIAKLRHVPTPDGRTPAEIEAERVRDEEGQRAAASSHTLRERQQRSGRTLRIVEPDRPAGSAESSQEPPKEEPGGT